MKSSKFSYKGMEITLDYQDDDHADIIIEGRKIPAVRHGGNLPSWACPQAYFMTPELPELARHLVDYWYIFTSPTTAPPMPHGHEAGGHGEEGHGQTTKKR